MQVCNNTVVSIRYVMKDSSGNIMEDTTSASAVEYLHGSGSILPQLENHLHGLSSGDKTNFSIDDASGGIIQFDVFIDSVRHAEREELTLGKPIFAAEQNNGACGPGCCC